eukprot:11200581-Lingulodinium_polyedra.AAC.1
MQKRPELAGRTVSCRAWPAPGTRRWPRRTRCCNSRKRSRHADARGVSSIVRSAGCGRTRCCSTSLASSPA